MGEPIKPMPPEHWDWVQRCDPSAMAYHLNQRTVFDGDQLMKDYKGMVQGIRRLKKLVGEE